MRPSSEYELIEMMKKIAANVLDEICAFAVTMSKQLRGTTISLSLDGWSNVHDEPILCIPATTSDGCSYLIDMID